MQTIQTDFHMHSTFSPDGNNSVRAMCSAAAKKGLTTIAFTEHKEWGRSFDAPFAQVDDYFVALEAERRRYSKWYRPDLTILSGVELGNPHENHAEAARFVEQHPFDITIASLHWIYGENVHNRRCFQNRDVHRVFADYFDKVREMVLDFEVDMLAHFDRILWVPALNSAEFNITQVEQNVRSLFEAVLARNVALELNTKLYRVSPNWEDSLRTMLGWFREAGGERVMINSDAHHTSHLHVHLDPARQLLQACGLSLETQIRRP
ncbi:MAG: histidinol-phosphatase HisJ family protein [Candidatus Promineifilaceae bacterium]